VQTLMLLVSASGILYAALWRWHHPHMPQVDLGAAALIVSMCVNFLVARRVAKVAKQTESSALAAEAVHLRADLWSCTGVLSGLAVTRIWSNPRLDPACAAIMTMFALASAIHLLRDIARPLLDESLPAAEQAEIKRVLGEDPRVLGYHKLRTRRAGSTRLCDVHVMLADDLSFRAAHAITEEIEEEIRRALPNLDVIVHAEPFEDEMERERSRARARARGEY